MARERGGGVVVNTCSSPNQDRKCLNENGSCPILRIGRTVAALQLRIYQHDHGRAAATRHSSRGLRLYYSAPRHFERIAIINSSSGPTWAFTTRSQVDEAIAKLKEEAARVGANGILLENIETSSSGDFGLSIGGFGIGGGHHSDYAVGGGGDFYGPILHKTAHASAIYVH